MEKTKFVIIRDYWNQGKTTTMWMLLKALLDNSAHLKELFDINHNQYIDVPSEIPPTGDLARIDFWAVLEWHDLIIVLNSRGDYVYRVVDDIYDALKLNPDYIVCTIQNRDIKSSTGNNIWNNFNKYFPNTKYSRICFWTEYTENVADANAAKQPIIEAIMKYIG